MSKTTICQNCNRRFEAQRRTRRTCSDACRQALHRSREAARRMRSGRPIGGYEEANLEQKISRDLNGIRSREAEPPGSRAILRKDFSALQTSGPRGGLLFPVVSDAELRRQRTPISASDSHLQWELRRLPPSSIRDQRPAHVREVAWEALVLLLEVEELGGLALSIPSLVNEPDLCREMGLEPDVLRKLLHFQERARELYDAHRDPRLLQEHRRRMSLPQARANRAHFERQDELERLAAQIHEWAVLTVTRTTSEREVSMTTIASDERLALDALRLTELLSESAEIAERLRARFPENAAVQAAVEAFLEQAQAQAA